MITPIQKQYAEQKAKAPDAVLLFKAGDFYEAFHDDAETLSKVCGMTLCRRGDVRMCGIPYYMLDASVDKLVKAGHQVVVSEPVTA
jgi:DNA mismatch repair protein MutS